MANYEADEQTPGDEYHGARISTGSDYVDEATRGAYPWVCRAHRGAVRSRQGRLMPAHRVRGANGRSARCYYTDNDDVKIVADNMISLGWEISQDVMS